MIEMESINEMFGNIRDKYCWNLNEPLLWGYFFIDKSVEKLDKAAVELTEMGYTFVEFLETVVEDGEEPYYYLQVEKAEIHTLNSLFERNLEFYDFLVNWD